MHIPRFRITTRRSMIAVAALALLLTCSGEGLSRRWGACRAASSRCESTAAMHREAASRSEKLAGLLDLLLRGEDPAGLEAQVSQLSPELDPGDPNWSPTTARHLRDSLLRSAAVEREKAAIFVETGRRSRRAFFLPWEPCISGFDLD